MPAMLFALWMLIGILAAALLAEVVMHLRSRASSDDLAADDDSYLNGRWVVVRAVEGSETIGYQVRWSKCDEDQRYLWVGHYYAGEQTSLGWCEVAAERHAERLNDQGKLPFEFRGS